MKGQFISTNCERCDDQIEGFHGEARWVDVYGRTSCPPEGPGDGPGHIPHEPHEVFLR